MKRSEFYKTYYKITNRVFSDRVIRTAEDRETSWRKRQHKTSKAERNFFIVLQYLILSCSWIPLLLAPNGLVMMGMSIALFWLLTSITDFSIVKIEILYQLYRKDTPCCTLLYKAFLGELDPFIDGLKKKTKKHITGYVRTNRGKFSAKYIAVSRDRNRKVALIIRHNHVTVKVDRMIYKISDRTLSIADLADEISAVIFNAFAVSNDR